MRKLLLIPALCMLFCIGTRALNVSAASAILVDGATGHVLFEKDADVRRPIASVTKLMTAFAAVGRAELDKTVSVTAQDVAVEGSSMYLRAGQRLTLRELLTGMLVTSGNDAARAAARTVCGTEEKFAALMNETAASIGMTATRFENASGLDGSDNLSTARDVARLTLAAASDAAVREMCGTKIFGLGESRYRNHNKLLWLIDGAECGKTGFTRRAGRCLASTAVRGGRRLAAVTLNAPDDWDDHAALFDFGFAQYRDERVCAAGEIVASIPAASGRAFDAVKLAAADEVVVKLAEGERVERVVYADRFAFAPIMTGARAGTVEFRVGDYVIGSSELVYAG